MSRGERLTTISNTITTTTTGGSAPSPTPPPPVRSAATAATPKVARRRGEVSGAAAAGGSLPPLPLLPPPPPPPPPSSLLLGPEQLLRGAAVRERCEGNHALRNGGSASGRPGVRIAHPYAYICTCARIYAYRYAVCVYPCAYTRICTPMCARVGPVPPPCPPLPSHPRMWGARAHPASLLPCWLRGDAEHGRSAWRGVKWQRFSWGTGYLWAILAVLGAGTGLVEQSAFLAARDNNKREQRAAHWNCALGWRSGCESAVGCS